MFRSRAVTAKLAAVVACFFGMSPTVIGGVSVISLGDVDGGHYDGAASVDHVPVDPDWLMEVALNTPADPMRPFDWAEINQNIPFTFTFDAGEGITGGILTLGIRGTAASTAVKGDGVTFGYNPTLLFKYSDLGWDPVSRDRMAVRSIDLSNANGQNLLHLLQDGQLDVLVRDDTLVDYARLTVTTATPVPEPTLMLLTLESYPPAQFPTVTARIEVSDVDDQLEISRQAALLAMSPEGWNLENLGLGTSLRYRGPSQWSGRFYFTDVLVSLPVSSELEDVFGFVLTETEGPNPGYALFFHNDEWAERRSHDIGESPDNYGVIAGGTNGNTWHRCPVPNWGRFSVTPIPEPSTLILLTTGVAGLLVLARRRKKKQTA